VLTDILLALNALLLLALFGLRAAKYVDRLEQDDPEDPYEVHWFLKPFMNYDAPITTTEILRERDESTGQLRMKVLLENGSTWIGYNNWWYEETSKRNASHELAQFLGRHYDQYLFEDHQRGIQEHRQWLDHGSV